MGIQKVSKLSKNHKEITSLLHFLLLDIRTLGQLTKEATIIITLVDRLSNLTWPLECTKEALITLQELHMTHCQFTTAKQKQSRNFVFIFKVKLVWSPFIIWQLMMDWKLKPNFQWMWYWQSITLFLWRETTPTLRSNHHLEWRLQRNTLMSNAHCGRVPQPVFQRHQGGEM